MPRHEAWRRPDRPTRPCRPRIMAAGVYIPSVSMMARSVRAAAIPLSLFGETAQAVGAFRVSPPRHPRHAEQSDHERRSADVLRAESNMNHVVPGLEAAALSGRFHGTVTHVQIVPRGRLPPTASVMRPFSRAGPPTSYGLPSASPARPLPIAQNCIIAQHRDRDSALRKSLDLLGGARLIGGRVFHHL